MTAANSRFATKKNPLLPRGGAERSANEPCDQSGTAYPPHPEYGQITIPFPIPSDEYDQTIEMLQAIEWGFSVNRDFMVDKVENPYKPLALLKNTMVNVDQLDYLAKRLAGFCAEETSQFQAMAYHLNLCGIKDPINLTFCCQRARVIANFNGLEQAGRDHRMNLNGGILPARNPNSWMSGRKPSSSSKAARGPSRPSASFMTMGCEWSSFTTGNISLRTYMTHTRWFWRRRPSRHRRKNRNTCIFPRPSVRLSGPYAGPERYPARTFSSKLK